MKGVTWRQDKHGEMNGVLIGKVFGTIANHKLAGSDSKNFGKVDDEGRMPSTGIILQSGQLTTTRSIDFTIKKYDVTEFYKDGDDQRADVMSALGTLEDKGMLVEEVAL
ncbi:MAG: hypothetical protein KC441_11685 [Anaerolineales bacterium]|nr:hypothetical protein [Anaerolineales bacterium]